MIKADMGKTEIKGLRPIVMVELTGILKAAKKVLGEELYKHVLKTVEMSKEELTDETVRMMKEVMEIIGNKEDE
nr:MAG TPA: hypothetical protein [Caudoviricetes sp.]